MSTPLAQTRALLVDAYRELNSKKLFWITLALSALVVAGFASLGLSDKGITLLWWDFSMPEFARSMLTPARFYKMLFVSFGIAFWLAWIATILALVSTAGLIPDLIAGGAVELALSKPIGRARLFLTKYVFGLLFTALQVGVFSLGCFLLIGIRGHSWEPRVFLAIPIVVAVFSFLFCVCVLLGMLTRSTVASLLLTLLFWFVVFLLNSTDAVITQQRLEHELRRERIEARLPVLEKAARNRNESDVREARAKAIREAQEAGNPTDGLTPVDAPIPEPTQAELEAISLRIHSANRNLIAQRAELKDVTQSLPDWKLAARITTLVRTPLPKTQETVKLLEHNLLSPGDFIAPSGDDDDVAGHLSRTDRRELMRRIDHEYRGRDIMWILGTSLAFEAVVLAIATWLFCRRDF